MNKIKIHTHLSNLHQLVSDINDKNHAITKHVVKVIESIDYSYFSNASKSSSIKKVPDDIKKEAPSLEAELETAYKILATETKPGPTLLKKEMGITLSHAKKLYNTLVSEGMIVPNKRAVKIAPIKERSVMDLINELPSGDNLLIPKPLQFLIALPEQTRAKYLKGLNLKDLVTPSAIEDAASNGANTVLVDEIDKLSKKTPLKVKDTIKLNDKYKSIVRKWAAAIPKGKELYKFMTQNGTSKVVLRDFKSIAVAVKNGDV